MESIPNPNTPVHRLLDCLDGVTPQGKGWQARCPAHDDRQPSLSVDLGDDGRVLLNCFAGCGAENIVEAVGMRMADLFPTTAPTAASAATNQHRIVSTHDYTDTDGNMCFQVVRFEPKSFRQRRPNDRGGWSWNLHGIEPILYRLPALMESPDERVWIVEGEKDADRLAQLGLLATTCPMGAGKWRDTYSESLRGRDVIILPDYDEPGRRHAGQITASLHAVARSVRIVELPQLPNKGDISDWLDLGHSKEELIELADRARPWEPRQQEIPTPSPPPFPLDSLPPVVREYCEAAARSIPVPVEMIAVPLLGFAGALIGNRMHLSLKDGWEEYPTLYIALVAPPGAAKSPALNLALRPLRALQQEAIQRYHAEMAQFESDEADAARRANGDAKLSKPTLRHYFSTDPTTEALVSMLSDSPGVAIHRDELVSWIKSMDQYRAGKGADRQVYLELWSAGAVKVDRKTSPTIYCDKPVVCVVGGIQPELVPELHHESRRRDGFVERILPVVIHARPAPWTEDTVPKETERAVVELFREIDDRSRPLAQTSLGHPQSVVLRLDPGAKRLWVEWHDRNARLIDEAEGVVAGFYLKLRSHVARFALILHALLHSGRPESTVAAAQMAGAIALAEFFREQFIQLVQLFNSTKATSERGPVPRVLKLLRNATPNLEEGWLSRSALINGLRDISAEELSDILHDLESQGTVERKIERTATKSTEFWRLKLAAS